MSNQEIVVSDQEQKQLAPTEGYQTTGQMIATIAELAKNPDVDVEKLDKLLDIQIRMMDRQAKIEYDQALARVQSEMPRIKENGEIKNKNGQVVAKFLKYEDIDKVIRPMLQAEGFSLTHSRRDANGKMVVTTALKHRNGHQESVDMPLPYDAPNQLKNAVQCAVSTYSYGKRVNVCSLLNIVAEGADDDGTSSEANYISEKQAAEIKEWLQRLYEAGKNVDTGRFIKYFGVQSVDEIPVKRYAEAVELLKRKEKEA